MITRRADVLAEAYKHAEKWADRIRPAYPECPRADEIASLSFRVAYVDGFMAGQKAALREAKKKQK